MVFVLVAALLLCTGCKREGDAVVNKTGETVRVVAATEDGREASRTLADDSALALPPHNGRRLFKLRRVQAFDLDGREIGEVRVQAEDRGADHKGFVRIVVRKGGLEIVRRR